MSNAPDAPDAPNMNFHHGASGAARSCFDPALARDRAAGAIFGAALGDALGLQVEGSDAETIAERHSGGAGIDLPYRGAFKGYPANDWTDATDFAVLVMRTLGAYFTGKTEDPARDFAMRAVQWHRAGFAELGDTAGVCPEGVVVRAMAQAGFLKDPGGAARAVKGPKADNGALIRTVACAFTAAPADWAALFCETTHADKQCVATAVMLTHLVGALSRAPASAPIPVVAAIAAAARGRDVLPEGAQKDDYMRRLTNTGRLEALGLGEREHRSHTLKTCAAAMWAFRRLARAAVPRDARFFKRTVRAVVAQGGDASANGAVVGAVLGAALGRANLPEDWLAALPHRDWLAAEVEAFLAAAAPTWARGGK
jgi:ADP-ribosyl-[dinitrogen reductase] hydrolase